MELVTTGDDEAHVCLDRIHAFSPCGAALNPFRIVGAEQSRF